MGYIVTRSFYEGDILHEQDQPFEHSNKEYVQKCLDDGNIAEGDAATNIEQPTNESGGQSATTHASGTEADQSQPPLDPPKASAQPTAEQLQQDFAQSGAQPQQNVNNTVI